MVKVNIYLVRQNGRTHVFSCVWSAANTAVLIRTMVQLYQTGLQVSLPVLKAGRPPERLRPVPMMMTCVPPGDHASSAVPGPKKRFSTMMGQAGRGGPGTSQASEW